MTNIRFFKEDIHFTLKNKTKIRQWITATIHHHQKKIQSINYIFTSDNYLLTINKEYLNHNTFTDIITFDNSSNPEHIETDIFISIQRVKANSNQLKISFTEELHRVMIHGILHLLGYKDKTTTERNEMRKKENHYLALRF